MRLLVIAAALSSLTLAHADAPVDGKVIGLNRTAFDTLNAGRKANLNNAFSEAEARNLSAAIMKPQPGEKEATIDPVESDLLRELTQSGFRAINVFVEGSNAEKLTVYTTWGNARSLLRQTLATPFDLEAAWAAQASGFTVITNAYAASEHARAKIAPFVQAKLAAAWDKSSKENIYKPLRDETSKLYGYSGAAGGNASNGRMMIYECLRDLDFDRDDAIPDFLYTWLKVPAHAGFSEPKRKSKSP
jgi:hypothetical protein